MIARFVMIGNLRKNRKADVVIRRDPKAPWRPCHPERHPGSPKARPQTTDPLCLATDFKRTGSQKSGSLPTPAPAFNPLDLCSGVTLQVTPRRNHPPRKNKPRRKPLLRRGLQSSGGGTRTTPRTLRFGGGFGDPRCNFRRKSADHRVDCRPVTTATHPDRSRSAGGSADSSR